MAEACDPGTRGDLARIDEISVQAVLNALPQYAMLIDSEHTILFANTVLSGAIGRAPMELVGQNCPRIVHNTDGPFEGCPLEECCVGEYAVERVLKNEENGHWIKSSVYPLARFTPQGRRVFLHLAEDVTEAQEAKLEIERAAKTRAALNDLLRLALDVGPLAVLLQRALDRVLTLPWLAIENKGAIFLADPARRLLTLTAQTGLGEVVQQTCGEVPFDRCLCGQAAADRAVVFAAHVDERHTPESAGVPHGHYCVPLLRGNDVLGVLALYVPDGHVRNPTEEEFLCAVADVLAGMIERDSLLRQNI